MRIFAKRFSIYDSHYCYHIVCGFFLIATERLTNINKTAVAIFIGTLGWMLYIGNGSDYIMKQHPEEYMIF